MTPANFLSKFNVYIKEAFVKSEIIKVLPDMSSFVVKLLPDDFKFNLSNYIDATSKFMTKWDYIDDISKVSL